MAMLLIASAGSDPWANGEDVPTTRLSVTVQAVDETIVGDLVSISADQLILRNESGERRGVPADSLRRVSREGRDSREVATGAFVPAIRVGLAGGSEVHVDRAEIDERRAQLWLTGELSKGPAISVPATLLQWVQFGSLSGEDLIRWRAMTEPSRSSDAMVIGRGEGLDSIGGTFLSLQQDRVRFDLGGDEVAAPVEKLRGVLLATATGDDANLASIEVAGHGGSRWRAQEVTMRESAEADPTLRMRIDDQWIEVPWSSVSELRFEAAVWNLGEDPVGIGSDSPPGLLLPPALAAAMGPHVQTVAATRRDPGVRVIDMAAPARMTFRVPEGFESLRATVGRSPDVHSVGRVGLRVLLDDQSAWQATLVAGSSGSDSSPGGMTGEQPLGLEVPLGSARRVTLVVDDGGDGSAGDLVRWVRPRLVK